MAHVGKDATLGERVRVGLADARARSARRRAFGLLRQTIPPLAATVPRLQDEVRAMKLAALADRGLVDRAVERLRANGCHVFVAASAAAARDYVLKVCAQPGILIKGKSNGVKEIGVKAALEAQGITWIDTDLGDWINQLAGTEGAHILGPAIHFTKEDFAHHLGRWLGEALPPDPTTLVRAARRGLRRYLEEARYGMTGANAIAAEEGAVVLMENEGNIRADVSLPEIHIVVAGIHKVVPTLRDAVKVVEAQSVFGVSQDFGTYCTTLTGPAPAGGFGPREVHVVLVDNGRRAAIDRGYAEAFTCLNCGSCLNFCPVYGVAGEGYGHQLLGGIGAIHESLLVGLLDSGGRPTGGADLLHLCMGCTRCIEYCPVRIDTPELTFRLKEEVYAHRPRPRLVQQVLETVRDPRRLRRVARWLRLYQRSGLRAVLRPLLPKRLRDLEAMAPRIEPLGPWPAFQPAFGPERGRVAYFLGCVMEAAMGDVHRATARVLRRAGYALVTPPFRGCCGALHEHAGDRAGARDLARALIRGLAETDGLPIVTNSAGCGAMLKGYGRLLADDPAWAEPARKLAARVEDFSEFLARVGLGPALAAAGPRADSRSEAAGSLRVTYQDPCHLAHAQGIVGAPRALLRSLPGVTYVEMAETEACCGSAGIYALGGEPQQAVSLALLADKLADARAAGAQVIVTANPGCLMHLRSGIARSGDPMRVLHIAELLDLVLERHGGKMPRPHGQRDVSAGAAAPPPEGVSRWPSTPSSPARERLVETAIRSLEQKGARVQLCSRLTDAAASIRLAIPPGATVAVHRSAPRGLLGLLEGRQAVFPEDLGEGARAAVLGAQFGLTGSTAVVARTGSVVLAEADGFGRAISNMCQTHVVVAAVADLVPDLHDGLDRATRWARETCARSAPPFLTIISGPSRTGDIEFVLVKGAHGPEHVLVYLVENLEEAGP